MQVETLDGVYRESRKLPPVSKPKIVTPHLIQGEELILSGIRAFLMPDGRDESYGSGVLGTGTNPTSGLTAGPVLLPAEGAIFLTNYRVIFRGRPCDPFYAELPVLRSFPISTLTKEKRISLPSNYLVAAIDHFIQEGLQLRSNTFQLLKIAFDEEVTTDQVDHFRKLVNRARCPPDIYSLFAFTCSSGPLSTVRLLPPKDKHGYSTFKGVARKTLARAGIQIKSHKSKVTNTHHISLLGLLDHPPNSLLLHLLNLNPQLYLVQPQTKCLLQRSKHLQDRSSCHLVHSLDIGTRILRLFRN